MPRRRMISPEFWDDELIGHLSDTQKLTILGCLGNADDEGRLKAAAEYLKASIFMYDAGKTDEQCLKIINEITDTMKSWPPNHPYLMTPYLNGQSRYLCFPNWNQHNRPSHATPSKLPVPPPDTLPIFSRATPEPLPNTSGGSPSQSSLGQSSQGKDSIGKVSAIQEDFTKFLDSEKDLTDLLTRTLEKYLPADGHAGATQAMAPIKTMWRQVTGREMDSASFQMIYGELKKYPPAILALCIVKAAKYSVGKRKPAMYIKTIFEDHAGD